HDVVKPALAAAGVTLDFWRVAIKPGKPLAIGRKPRPGRREAIAFGVPGNPASALVTFSLFGVPLLRPLQGDAPPFPAFGRARIAQALAHGPGRREFARAVLSSAEGGLRVTPFDNQASGAVTSMARADALIVVPEDSGGVGEGDEVDVLLLSDLEA